MQELIQHFWEEFTYVPKFDNVFYKLQIIFF